jgi:uncharacterized membrane protein
MRSTNYYRVRRVVRAVFWLGVLSLIYLIATRIWWGDDGLCIGTILECGL